jgi:hypothetical protein
MTLQSSGQISLGDIRDEFGDSNPASIDEYVDKRVAGFKTIGNDNSLAFSDFYHGTNSPLLNSTMTVVETHIETRSLQYTGAAYPNYGTPYNTPILGFYDTSFFDVSAYPSPVGTGGTAGAPRTVYSYNLVDADNSFGSMTYVTFTGNNSVSATISGLFWKAGSDVDGAPGEAPKLWMTLTNTNAPTFRSITVNGNAYAYASANQGTSTRGGDPTYRYYNWTTTDAGEEFGPFDDPDSTSTCLIWITP